MNDPKPIEAEPLHWLETHELEAIKALRLEAVHRAVNISAEQSLRGTEPEPDRTPLIDRAFRRYLAVVRELDRRCQE